MGVIEAATLEQVKKLREQQARTNELLAQISGQLERLIQVSQPHPLYAGPVVTS